MLVLVPKGYVDTHGYKLLEVVWKVVEAVIDTRIRSIFQFHNVLQNFCARRVSGTAIVDLKLV